MEAFRLLIVTGMSGAGENTGITGFRRYGLPLCR